MRKIKYVAQIMVAVMLIGLVITACGKADKENDAELESEKTETETVFGTFTSQTLSGDTVTQDIFAEADLTMVNIWGTFCGPCINEMPELGELGREYKERGVQIVGMLCDVTKPGDETALEIVEVTKADYIHIVASMDLQNGILGSVQAVPTTIFVDKEGNQVGEIYAGARDKEEWAQIIEELLEKVGE